MISIVMAYYNRLPQLVMTLRSIASQYPIKDKVEVIVFDENSRLTESPEKHIKSVQYPFDIRLIKSEKLAENPCCAYNKAFTFARGDRIIIQNPECVHVGKVIDCVSEHLSDDNYLSFSAFSLDQANTEEFLAGNKYDPGLLSRLYKNTTGQWFNHPKYKPTNFHFLTAITKKNLTELGGFDERYKDGKCFDDNELVERIKRKGLKINPVTWPMAMHLWHPQAEPRTDAWTKLWVKNNRLFYDVTMKEKTWKANQQS